jgi:hypothetical protein
MRLLLAVRHGERRLFDRLEGLDDRVAKLDERIDKVGQRMARQENENGVKTIINAEFKNSCSGNLSVDAHCRFTQNHPCLRLSPCLPRVSRTCGYDICFGACQSGVRGA